MRSKDLLRFFIVAALFVGGMIWWQVEQAKNRPPRKEKELTAEQKNEAVIGLLGSATARDALVHIRDNTNADVAARVKLQAHWKDKPGPWFQAGILAGGSWEAGGARIPKRETPRPALVHLGDESPESDYHIAVDFDPRGASVSRLKLNKFQAANFFGRKEPETLTLLPDDGRGRSFQLYHYGPSEESVRPFSYLGETAWQGGAIVKNEDSESVSFWTEINGVKITKTFRLEKKSYHIALDVKLEKAAKGKDVTFRYQLAGGRGLPLEGQWYTATHRHSLIAQVERGAIVRDMQELGEISLWLGGNEITVDTAKRLQYAAVAVQYFASAIAIEGGSDDDDFIVSARPTLEARVVKVVMEGPLERDQNKIIIKDRKDPTKGSEVFYLSEKVQAELSNTEKFRKGSRLGLVCVPNDKDQLEAVEVLPESETHPLLHDDITVRVNTKSITLTDDNPVVHSYVLYNGPIKPKLLGQMTGVKEVKDDYVTLYLDELHLNTLTDYQSRGFFGSFANAIFWTQLLVFFTNIMHSLLNVLHYIVPNYGICIILLTVLVRSLMLPISRKQAYTTMKMQQLAPEIKKLKAKHKDDRQAMAMAQMALFRKHGINPLGSCWLLLLQLPVFMGLYYCLQESVHFRLAGFLWIDNLAAPDMLIWWGEGMPILTARESLGGFLYLGPYFNLLPILAITLMIMQQKLMMPPPTDEQQAAQQKMMRIMMIVFGVLFYKVAAGLCLYFIVSTLWGVAERKLLPKKKPGEGPAMDDISLPTSPASNSTAVKTASPVSSYSESNRNRRRQERKKRQQDPGRKQADLPESAGEASAKPREDEGGGIFAKLGRWWRNMVRKASKK